MDDLEYNFSIKNEEKIKYEEYINELIHKETSRVNNLMEPVNNEFEKDIIMFNKKFNELKKILNENNVVTDILKKLSVEEEASGKQLIKQNEEFLESITKKTNRLQNKHKRLELKLSQLKGKLN
jgi:hypothetical protein